MVIHVLDYLRRLRAVWKQAWEIESRRFEWEQAMKERDKVREQNRVQ